MQGVARRLDMELQAGSSRQLDAIRDHGVADPAPNFTDPDSRIMKRAGGGFDASSNAQSAVDQAAHIVVAAELTNIGSDAAEMPRMLASIKSNLGQAPRQAVADTGCRSEAVLEQLADGATDMAHRTFKRSLESPTR